MAWMVAGEAESKGKIAAPFEIRCARAGLSQSARQPPGGYATAVATPPPPLTKGEFPRFTEADSLYRRALGIAEKSLGSNHPDVAQTLADYALLLRKTKRKSEAVALNARAREILARNPALRSAQQTVDVQDLDRTGNAWRQ